jgi:subtilase family serine protease
MKSLFAIFVIILLAISPMGSFCSAAAITASPAENLAMPLPGYALQGQAPGDLPVLVNLAIPLRNVDVLGSLLEHVSDPSSALYRHFLTPVQIEQQFLPTTEYNSMLAYLHSMGLHVLMSSMDSIIVFQATAAQVKEYFDANVNIYSNGTDSYYMTSGNSLFNGAHFIASNATGAMVQPRHTNLSPAQQNANITYTEGAFSAKELQNVYNATSLYAQGLQGEGQTIGILDFFGSPTVAQDLSLFDKTFGFQDPRFTIIPIVPYNPNLGVSTGWSTEVALDVEMAHAMAPRAAVNLYVTTGALSFAADLAPIVYDDSVTTLSMSFSIGPEWLYSLVGGGLFYFNMFLPDLYFMIGSLEGITFLCSSGDAGGSGYSSGPTGNLGYPSDSPYVTSTGGTQTYLYAQPNGTRTFVQIAWSNPGYVPNGVNSGGSGGGVSFLEPKPWYQQSQQTPPTYPNGRMEPDLSLQAGIDPGIIIVNSGSLMVVGGTSASVQLLSGLLTLIAQSSGGPLGLLNPFLYSLGNDANIYNKAYNPITFGYNIPWTASSGYNLVTGWGAPNIGEMSLLYNAQLAQPSLSIYVDFSNASGQAQLEFTPNQVINVSAYIYNGNSVVNSGNFSGKLVTLAGTSMITPLTFDNSIGTWNASLIMGQQSGVAYIDVYGTSAGLSGEGFAQIFAGYLATFLSPTPTNPWTTANGLQVTVASTDLDGNPAPSSNLTMQVNSYSILSNSYLTVDAVNLVPANLAGVGSVTVANLTLAYPAGPIALILQGSTYGFLPFTNGIYLQTSVIQPEVAVEPASIGPGQSLTIATSPVAPLNVANTFSLESGGTVGSDVAAGSSVTAFLVNASGFAVASSALVYQSSRVSGFLQVPTNSPSGLYTILLRASYGSLTLGYTLGGSFYSEIWVSNSTITPSITLSPSTLFMGQTAQLIADIRYPNGQEVTQGEYTTLIYPQELQNTFMSIMYAEYRNFELIPLSFNSTLNRWIGNIALPSPYNAGALSPVNDNSFVYSGPYEAYVTGISYDGVPTTTALSAQQSFIIQPYVYVSNQLVTSFQQNWGLALSEVNITGSASLTQDLFLGSNTLQSGNTTISDSIINGTLNINNSNLTLQGVHGGNIIATNSSINLVNTDLSSITLVNSHLSMTSSSYQTINPAPPTIQILSPQSGSSYKGDVTVTITVSGSNINEVTTYLNGQTIQTFTNNGTISFIISTANYPDGTYVLQAVATQSDDINSNANSTIFLQNQLNSTQSAIDSLSSAHSNTQNQLNSLSLVQSNIQNQLNSQGSNLNSLSSGQSSLQNQLGGLGNSLNSLNSAQSSLQNQTNNLNSSLNNLNSSQSALHNQLGDLGNSLNASLDKMQNEIGNLKESLNTAETAAIAGIGIGLAGIALAVEVTLRKRSKNQPTQAVHPSASS